MKIRSSLKLVAAVAMTAAFVIAAHAGASEHALAAKACSVQGLRFTYGQAGATFSVRVTRLTATAFSCGDSRLLASEVAKDLLHNRKVPARFRGLRVLVKKPCAGCSPDDRVTATGSARRGVVSKVTFDVLGGT